MEDVIIPYELPDVENHSFFFIDQRIDTRLEAKLHQQMLGNSITWYTDTEPEWPATPYRPFRKETWY